MTAKDKAEELFGKFADIEHFGVYENYDDTLEWSSSLWRQQVKQCALIAVDEIEKQEAISLGYDYNIYSSEYWQKVKQEINKL